MPARAYKDLLTNMLKNKKKYAGKLKIAPIDAKYRHSLIKNK